MTGHRTTRLEPGDRLSFTYVNSAGRQTSRSAVFRRLQWSNPPNHKPGWFLHCYDCNRDAPRSFALDLIQNLHVNGEPL